MLILIVLLACLVSILMITLLNISKVNSQIILFLSTLILMILFKFILNKMIKINSLNPISKNLISNINLNNQTPKDNKVDEILNKIKYNIDVFNKNNRNNEDINKIPTTNNQVKPNSHLVFAIAHCTNKPNQELIQNNELLPNIENVNEALSKLGNKVFNVNTNANLEANLVSSIPKNSPKHSCLLEKCPCEKISQNVCCNSIDTNKTPCGNCPTSDFINGEKVNKECLKNNNINYADVFNSDANKQDILKMNVPSSDCAFDNSCVTPAFAGTLHFAPPKLNNSNSNSNSNSNFWHGNENMEIMQREKQKFSCN